MKLYDDVIASVEALCAPFGGTRLPIQETDWPDLGKENLIFRQDMAYELGGSDSRTFALGATAVTQNVQTEDEILLIGPDLPEIKADTPYARIAVVRVAPDTLGQGNVLYNAVKKMEFVRYHVNPEGFMTRVSLINGRESVRVSKAALGKGLTFATAGNMMLSEYHKNASIQSVKLIFITDPAFPFARLQSLTKEAEKITKAIDHILRSGMTDCGSCSLQKICEEVEGMKELHFGLAAEKG